MVYIYLRSDTIVFLSSFLVLPTISTSSCCKNEQGPIFEPSKSIEFSPEASGSTDNIGESGQASGHELPLFNFICISLATNNFSEGNKLGQGGFGPVYKVSATVKLCKMLIHNVTSNYVEN